MVAQPHVVTDYHKCHLSNLRAMDTSRRDSIEYGVRSPRIAQKRRSALARTRDTSSMVAAAVGLLTSWV